MNKKRKLLLKIITKLLNKYYFNFEIRGVQTKCEDLWGIKIYCDDNLGNGYGMVIYNKGKWEV